MTTCNLQCNQNVAEMVNVKVVDNYGNGYKLDEIALTKTSLEFSTSFPMLKLKEQEQERLHSTQLVKLKSQEPLKSSL